MNLGWTEILLIGGIALILFGPKRLPGLGRSLGESIRGFKKALSEDPQEEREAPREQIPQKKETPMNAESEVTQDERDVTKKS